MNIDLIWASGRMSRFPYEILKETVKMENVALTDKACPTVVRNTEFIILKCGSIWEYWQAVYLGF